MVKPIEITNNKTNETYVLEFNRDSVRFAEGRGFDIQAFAEGKAPLTGTSDLFYYAFRMHHPKMSKAETDRMLFEELGGVPDGLITRLVELYGEPFSALVGEDDEEERKNSIWTVSL